MRSIRAARETFAAVALTGLTLGTVLRCVDGRPGGIAGVILTVIAVAVLSRYRVSWDEDGICSETPFSCRRISWTELSAYSVEPEIPEHFMPEARRFTLGQPCRIRLHGRRAELTINLKPYSWQDIRHLTQRVSTDISLRETSAALVS